MTDDALRALLGGPNPFMGLSVEIVEPGTVIAKDAEGRDMTVTDSSAVHNGNQMWVTRAVWEALIAQQGAGKGGE